MLPKAINLTIKTYLGMSLVCYPGYWTINKWHTEAYTRGADVF